MRIERGSLEQLLQKWNAEGRLFPQYRFHTPKGRLHLLGKGGFSYVYEMERKERPHGRFALKVMETEAGQSDSFLENLGSQQLLGEICPYVMPIVDVTVISGLICILMKQLTGILQKDENGCLQLCREELRYRSGVLFFAMEIGRALQISHEKGILHGDIKPENSYWNADQNCYQLGDFGNHGGYTRGYAAPELICTENRRKSPGMTGGAGQLTVASDIYAYGMMLYVLLNELRFPGAEGYYCNW